MLSVVYMLMGHMAYCINNIMLLITLFRIGPITGPRSAVFVRGRRPMANTADRGPETRPIRKYLSND